MLPEVPGGVQRRRLILLACLVATATASKASADPQANAVLTTGIGDVSLGSGMVGAFHLGARADVLFLRDSDRTMGIGPFVGVASEAFRSASFEGGVDWLVPAPSAAFPFTLAAGAYERLNEAGARRGVLGEVMWGSHGYNFNGQYDLAFGLFVEVRYALGETREEDVLGGVAIDLSLFGYPFLLAYQAITR